MAEEIFEGGMTITKKCVKWKLNNFAVIFAHDILVRKQKMMFDVVDSNGVTSKWMMSLDFTEGDRSSQPRFLTLFVTLVSTSSGSSYVDANFSPEFLGKPGVCIFRGYPVQTPRYLVGRKTWWVINTLRTDTYPGQMLTDEGSMVIKLDVNIFGGEIGGIPDNSGVDFEGQLVSERQKEVCQKISLLENDEENSDVTIVSKDEQKFFAYRWMLAGASDVFEAMFRVDMEEKNSGQVKLEDLSGKAVKVLLHYIYTGKMLPEWVKLGIVEEIVLASDKYQITKLKNYLEYKLGKVCTVETAGSLLNLANQTGLKAAVPEILKFVKDNIKDPESFYRMASGSLTEYQDIGTTDNNLASSSSKSDSIPLVGQSNSNPNIGEVVRNYFSPPSHSKRPRQAESFSELAGSHQSAGLYNDGGNLPTPVRPPPCLYPPNHLTNILVQPPTPAWVPGNGNAGGLPFHPGIAPTRPNPYAGIYSHRCPNSWPTPPQNQSPWGTTSPASGYGCSDGQRGQGQPPSDYPDSDSD